MKDYVNYQPLSQAEEKKYKDRILGALCVIGLLFLTFIIGCL